MLSGAERYDAGLLGGDESWTVDMWQDYIRSELDRSHDHYSAQIEGVEDQLSVANDKLELLEKKITDLWQAV